MNKMNSHCESIVSLFSGRTAIVALTTLLALNGMACDEAPGSDRELTWEEFELASRIDPDVRGAYRFEDIQTGSEERLRSFYDRNIRPRAWVESNYFDAVNDRMTIMDPETRLDMTYCIDNTATDGWSDATEHAAVVTLMHNAAVQWERAADVNFIYDSSKDGNCVDGTSGVYFAVRKLGVSSACGSAFFPDEAATFRFIRIKYPALVGCDNYPRNFSHELGHVLGLRHEADRADCNNLNQDASDVYLSEYDTNSVMHYNACGSPGSVSAPSRRDVAGVRAAYSTPKDNWRHSSVRQSSDFNGDGKKDIYWYRTEPRASPPAPPTDVILYGAAAPTFVNSANSPTSNLLRPIAGDYDLNGRTDIFFYEQGTHGTTETVLFKQAGNLDTFSTNTAINVDDFHQPLSGYFFTQNEVSPTADIAFYGPGPATDRELAAAPATPAGFQWLFMLGCVMWDIGDGTNYYTPIVGDFDGNLATDIFFYNSDDAGNSEYFSNAAGTGFNCMTPTPVNLSLLVPGSPVTSTFYAHVTGRFDSGGNDDILSYSPGSVVQFLFGGASGPGTTQANAPDPMAGEVFRPFGGDFDGDGIDDIYWFNTAVNGIDRVWWMTGVGATFVETTINAGLSTHHDRVPIAGDYTGDGRVDILWWYPLDGSLSLWRGEANKTFSVNNLGDTVHGFPVGYGLH